MANLEKIVESLWKQGEDKKLALTKRHKDHSLWLQSELAKIEKLILQNPRDNLSQETSESQPCASSSSTQQNAVKSDKAVEQQMRGKRKSPETAIGIIRDSPEQKRNSSTNYEELAVNAGLPSDLNRLKKEQLISELESRGINTFTMKALKKDLVDALKVSLAKDAAASLPPQNVLLENAIPDREESSELESTDPMIGSPCVSSPAPKVGRAGSLMDIRRSLVAVPKQLQETEEIRKARLQSEFEARKGRHRDSQTRKSTIDAANTSSDASMDLMSPLKAFASGPGYEGRLSTPDSKDKSVHGDDECHPLSPSGMQVESPGISQCAQRAAPFASAQAERSSFPLRDAVQKLMSDRPPDSDDDNDEDVCGEAEDSQPDEQEAEEEDQHQDQQGGAFQQDNVPETEVDADDEKEDDEEFVGQAFDGDDHGDADLVRNALASDLDGENREEETNEENEIEDTAVLLSESADTQGSKTESVVHSSPTPVAPPAQEAVPAPVPAPAPSAPPAPVESPVRKPGPNFKKPLNLIGGQASFVDKGPTKPNVRALEQARLLREAEEAKVVEKAEKARLLKERKEGHGAKPTAIAQQSKLVPPTKPLLGSSSITAPSGPSASAPKDKKGSVFSSIPNPFGAKKAVTPAPAPAPSAPQGLAQGAQRQVAQGQAQGPHSHKTNGATNVEPKQLAPRTAPNVIPIDSTTGKKPTLATSSSSSSSSVPAPAPVPVAAPVAGPTMSSSVLKEVAIVEDANDDDDESDIDGEDGNLGYQIASDRDSSGNSGSDTDDEEEEQAKQQSIPEWARGANLKEALERQYGLNGHTAMDPDLIFCEVMTCNLEDIFGCREGKSGKYASRSSSAHWTEDELTIVEKRNYRSHMGYAGAGNTPTAPRRPAGIAR